MPPAVASKVTEVGAPESGVSVAVMEPEPQETSMIVAGMVYGDTLFVPSLGVTVVG